jgi:hypothetical protein
MSKNSESARATATMVSPAAIRACVRASRPNRVIDPGFVLRRGGVIDRHPESPVLTPR